LAPTAAAPTVAAVSAELPTVVPHILTPQIAAGIQFPPERKSPNFPKWFHQGDPFTQGQVAVSSGYGGGFAPATQENTNIKTILNSINRALLIEGRAVDPNTGRKPYTRDELSNILGQLGLTKSGTKPVQIQRIINFAKQHGVSLD
jgi:hypothetical protein